MAFVAILTGDIARSRQKAPAKWLASLKSILKLYGETPKAWEVFRGDSFQLEVPVADCVQAALLLKATLRKDVGLNIRLGIGIGDKSYRAQKITQSNGSAFIRSGECFESIKKDVVAIKSPWPEMDEELNLYLQLASLIINGWTKVSAETVQLALRYPTLSQVALAKKLKKSQSNISAALGRAGFEEMLMIDRRYKQLLKSQE